MKNLIGYWQRGNQFWHIKKDKTLLINLPEKNRHYDGDAHIFFKSSDSPVFCHAGRKAITKQQFEKVRNEHLERMNNF